MAINQYGKLTFLSVAIRCYVVFISSMRYRPFPTEEELASLDEEALKAKEEAEKEKDEDEEEEWLGEIELSKSIFTTYDPLTQSNKLY